MKLVIAILISLPLIVSAHSGGTNSKGCHNVYDPYGNQIGYHCH